MKKHRSRHIKRQETNDIKHTAVAFLCVTAAAVVLSVGVSFSKMLSRSGVHLGGMQAAAFIVETSGQANQKFTINYTEAITEVQYPFTVTNQRGERTAEVSMQYYVVVTLPSALPDGVTVTLDGKNGTVSEDKTVYTFANMGSFQAGQNKTNSHILKITVDPWAVTGTYLFEKIGISVHAEQTN